jgi:hypothetical protein
VGVDINQELLDQAAADYGTFSHFNQKQSTEPVTDICRHAQDRALFTGDWLGRWSYEWQDLWEAPLDREYFMDYRISYIYPKGERDKVDVATFPLRLMCRIIHDRTGSPAVLPRTPETGHACHEAGHQHSWVAAVGGRPRQRHRTPSGLLPSKA